MIHIDRLAIPDILVRKQAEWQQKYEEKLKVNPAARPDSSKYAHPDIKLRLGECSYDKCFYCETLLSGGEPKEVDHFMEVAIDHSKAFDWDNLYLACTKCNDKADHNTIPVNETLDPCRDSDEEISRNIYFKDEMVCAHHDSKKGPNTIRKYHLNSESLQLKRSRHLKYIMKSIMNIQAEMIKEGRHDYTDAEKTKLLSFIQKDQPYSMMCKQFINNRFPGLI